MSSRAAEKRRVREQREQRERAAALAGQRKRRLGMLAGAVLVAAAVVAIAVVVSSSGGPKEQPRQASATTRLFVGIPQKGVVLGDPKAPLTLTEFADLQCPVCKAYTLEVLPTLMRRYVRAGRVRMVFRNISILGPDSRAAAEAAAAAALQDRVWQFADRFYHDQGQENTGYVNDSFIERVAGQVRGLNVPRLLGERDSQAAQRELAVATTDAQVRGVNSTPTFYLGRTGRKGKQLQYGALTVDQFTGPIDQQLQAR